MIGEADARALAYQVLDQVLVGTSVPPGLRGAMFSVVDSLRGTAAPVDVRRAEKVSVAIQQLEWALQRRDTNATAAVRNELKALAAAWLNTRIAG